MLPLTPTRLGRYEIVDEIGKGAMGVVYLARDPLIGRLVALKTFRIGYSVKDQELEQFRVRFMREAQSAGILTHPNIVTIHDVVEASEEGLAFIAMEYVRGTNLKLMLQAEQPLSPRFVVDVLAQVGDALDYAHSNRVIHRDVKPANILITTDNRVKITDFGIARLDSSNLTQEGQLLGTPNYMAPEQIQGREVDHRADLFSLGVVLYEMFTRHKPFQGENLTVVSHRIVYDHFTPPRDYQTDLPQGIDRILAKALEKDPARRYQRARELVDDLRRVVDSTSVRDALNETQSLSSTLVLPPGAAPLPPPRPPKPSLFSRWRKAPPSAGAAGSPSTRGSSPPLPAAPPSPPAAVLESTVPTGQARLPAARGRGSAPRRLLAATGIVLAVAILGGAAVLLWRSWTQPPPAPPAAVDGRQMRVAALIREGSRALQKGEYGMALALFRQAEQLAPGSEEVRGWREAAEAQAEDYRNLVDVEKEIAAQLDSAQRSLAARRYDQAARAARLALGIDDGNEEARRLLAEAEKGLAARSAGRGPAPAQPGAPEVSEPLAATPPAGEALPGRSSEPSPVVAREAKIQVRFQSEIDCSLIVWVDGVARIRETLKSGGLRGIFGSAPKDGYNIGRTIDLPPGPHRILVHATPLGKRALAKNFDHNFREGSSHHLEIFLSRAQQLTAEMN